MNSKVWKVTCFHIDDSNENLFEAYFTDEATADAMYDKGERESVGYQGIRWDIEEFDLDNPCVEEMFCKLMEELK